MYAISRLHNDLRNLFDPTFSDWGLPASKSVLRHDYSMFKRKDDQTWVLELAVPGMSEKEVQVRVDQETHVLTVKAHHESSEKKEKDEQIIWSKRAQNDFFYSFTLGDDLDLDTIEAKCSKGMLTIEIKEKATEEKPQGLKEILVSGA